MRPRKDEELEWGRWFAVAGPGLEEVVGAELRAIRGVEEVVAEEGGAGFEAPLALGPTINRSLRVASRVLLRLGDFPARGFDDMKARGAALPWGMVLRPSQDVRFEVSANKSRLYHTGAIADALAAAIGKALGGPVTPAKGVVGEGIQRVFARGVRDRWTISVDSSGELLHRRGWRVEAGEAPLRETLAAGMLALAKWDGREPLVDLMCGSGTIAIEAATRARGIAPGLGRGFVCETWPVMKLLGRGGGGSRAGEVGRTAAPTSRVPSAAEDAATSRVASQPQIVGFDQDPAMLAIAGRNAVRAGVADAIEWRQVRWPAKADVVGVLPTGPGLVLVNPPYGRRLGDEGPAAALATTIGKQLRAHFAGWRAGVLLADARWADRLGFRIDHPNTQALALQNGGLRVTYVLAEVPSGT